MLPFDLNTIIIFFIVFVSSFLVLINVELDENLNDKWTKFGMSLVISSVVAGLYYAYIYFASDELLTGNFAFDEVVLPETGADAVVS